MDHTLYSYGPILTLSMVGFISMPVDSVSSGTVTMTISGSPHTCMKIGSLVLEGGPESGSAGAARAQLVSLLLARVLTRIASDVLKTAIMKENFSV